MEKEISGHPSGNKKPSVLASEDRKTSQGFVDLRKKTEIELIELLERQEHILKNKSFVSKLPDKGEKITSFKAELEKELKSRRENLDIACQLLSGLNISSKPEDMEWNKGDNIESSKEKLDSDDDSDVDVDPLKLVATHSGTTNFVKKKKKIQPEPSLITEDDIKEAREFNYAEEICNKYGKIVETKERFKPNQLRPGATTSFIKSAENVKKKLGDKWEVTEATPPVPVHKDTKIISLEESMRLQKEQAERLKEIERKQAAEKLMRQFGVKIGEELPTRNITEYRSVREKFVETVDRSDEESDDERKNAQYLLDEES